jgi:diaminopropionate ammonia-lyase
VAGLAAALIAAGEPPLAETLALDSNSRVLFFGTEGASDPELYREIVGRPAEAVRDGT